MNTNQTKKTEQAGKGVVFCDGDNCEKIFRIIANQHNKL